MAAPCYLVGRRGVALNSLLNGAELGGEIRGMSSLERPRLAPTTCFQQAALCTALVFMACEKSDPPPSSTPPATASVTASLPVPPAAEAPVKAVPSSLPMLAHLSPSWGNHGKLPKGLGIAVGRTIPDVGALDTNGQRINLLEAVRQGPTVLLFYRGGFCDFVNYQLRSLVVRGHQFEKVGVPFILISPDSPEAVAATRAAHNIQWPMLSDADLSIIKAFKLTHEITDPELAEIKRFKMQPPKAPAGGRAMLTYPAVFLVDEQGKVKWAHAETNPEMLVAPDQILDGIKQSGLGPKPASPEARPKVP